MVPRLCELAPHARGSQEAGFTQPRDHSFAQPCILICPCPQDVQPSHGSGGNIPTGCGEGDLIAAVQKRIRLIQSIGGTVSQSIATASASAGRKLPRCIFLDPSKIQWQISLIKIFTDLRFIIISRSCHKTLFSTRAFYRGTL